jgi:hypothetical protein
MGTVFFPSVFLDGAANGGEHPLGKFRLTWPH